MRLLFLGGSYGSILASKSALAGHEVDVVCKAQELDNINNGRVFVEYPIADGRVLDVSRFKQRLRGISPQECEPANYELCFLCMQEPQFLDPEVSTILKNLAAVPVPAVSLMNMPLQPFLRSRLGIALSAQDRIWSCYNLWSSLEGMSLTATSPDPQGIVEITESSTHVKISLASNFKVAPFENPVHQTMLETLAADVNGLVFDHVSGAWSPGAKLVPHVSPYVPLAKWPMLITGNFRCIHRQSVRSIEAAIWDDIEESRQIYEWVSDLCQKLISRVDASFNRNEIFVPFDRYADAAHRLVHPSSLARGLTAGVTQVERFDKLIYRLACLEGQRSSDLDMIVTTVDTALHKNRS